MREVLRRRGRPPSLAPGRYFRMLLLGSFEGLDSERTIAWRAADSLSLRQFLDVALHEAPPPVFPRRITSSTEIGRAIAPLPPEESDTESQLCKGIRRARH